jgi:hypothetical protein
MLKGGFHEHALADARPVGCDVKPIADTFAKPNSYFAARRSSALARRSKVNAISLRIQFGELLHLTFPNTPGSRLRFRDTIDEVNQFDENYRKGQAELGFNSAELAAMLWRRKRKEMRIRTERYCVSLQRGKSA